VTYALAFPTWYELCYRCSWAGRARAGGTALVVLKFAFGLLTVLLPTVLMGDTAGGDAPADALAERPAAETGRAVLHHSAGAVVGTYLATSVAAGHRLEYTMFAGRR